VDDKAKNRALKEINKATKTKKKRIKR
jgi:hypothetical protein